MDDIEMKKLLTLQQVAQRLQISETTLYKLARKGKIPAIKVGNQWRFKKEDIDKWLESQKVSEKKKKG
jgi:excisionase family DNA binding protein